jgi:4-amino-4-deoxy-L-arabinose transferase-like glycosyltransferase
MSGGEAQAAGPRAMLSRAMSRRLETALLAWFAVAAALSAVAVPVFEAPDEPFHLDYVNFLLERHELPDQLDESKRVFREGHQPPLYYALAALVTLPFRGGEAISVRLERNPQHALGGGRRSDVPYYDHAPPGPFPDSGSRAAFYALRILGIVFGVANLLLVLRIARRFLPEQGAWLAAAIVATLPQFLFISGSINNDNLANLVATALILASLRVFERPERTREWIALGLLLGLGLCVKKTVLALVPPIAVLVVWLFARGNLPRLRLAAHAAAALAATLAVGGWVLVRNQLLYGDPLGSEMERRTLHFLVSDQSVFSPYFRGIFWTATLQSFVGMFGWMQLRLPAAAYGFWWLLLLLGTAAGAWRALGAGERRAPVVLAIGFSTSCLAAAVYYNSSFPEPQGRFLFPGLAAIAGVAALGLERIGARFPGAGRIPAIALLLVLMAIDAAALLRIARFY